MLGQLHLQPPSQCGDESGDKPMDRPHHAIQLPPCPRAGQHLGGQLQPVLGQLPLQLPAQGVHERVDQALHSPHHALQLPPSPRADQHLGSLAEVNGNVDDAQEELNGEQIDKVINYSESVDIARKIVDHVLGRVEKSLKFNCPKCLISFRDSYQMNRHFKSVHGEAGTCKRCNTVLDDKERCIYDTTFCSKIIFFSLVRLKLRF